MGVLTEFAFAQVFIETGLGHGQSLKEALKQPFERLHTIELDATLIAMCYDLMQDSRLTIHHGSSPDLLPTVIDPTQTTMFWLDAHYSAGQYTSDHQVDLDRLDPRFGQCPLLAELQIIRDTPWVQRPWIYIDDAVCFDAPVYEGMFAQYDRKQYPTAEQVQAALPPDYVLERIEQAGLAYRATPKELL